MNANWDTMRLKMIANKYVNASRNQKKKSHECTKKERNTHKTNRIESNRKVPSFWPLSLVHLSAHARKKKSQCLKTFFTFT